LGFKEFALAAEVHDLLIELGADVVDGALHLVFGHDIVDGGVDEDLLLILEKLAGKGVDGVDAGDLVAEEFDAVSKLFVAGMDLDDVAADAEGGPFEVHVVAGVLEVDELAEHFVAIGFDVFADGDDGGLVGFGGAEAEDAGDGGDE
jgi:hypothetical protein